MQCCIVPILLGVLLLAAGVIAAQTETPEIVLIIGLPFAGVVGVRFAWWAVRLAWESYQDRRAW